MKDMVKIEIGFGATWTGLWIACEWIVLGIGISEKSVKRKHAEIDLSNL